MSKSLKNMSKEELQQEYNLLCAQIGQNAARIEDFELAIKAMRNQNEGKVARILSLLRIAGPNPTPEEAAAPASPAPLEGESNAAPEAIASESKP